MVFPPSSYGAFSIIQFAKKVFNHARFKRDCAFDFARILRFSDSSDLKMHHESHRDALSSVV
ncbi:MAG TPA: hypothetical protein DDZ68_04385 [Parvularcula sp.]|nr:hypothetical protein [Parvularcula sp.]HBS32254.1 hypothetical protein [Parvularcula sp.]HBS34717.1 hypothetical protein [Parvularcula sp.]